METFPRCPVSCPAGPLVPSCVEAGQGSHSPLWAPVTGQHWAGPRQRSAGGRKPGVCRGTESASPNGERRHCSLTWSWWRGKLFVTPPLLSHLLIDKHWTRTAEWRTGHADVRSPGRPILLPLVLTPSSRWLGPGGVTCPAGLPIRREKGIKRIVKAFENVRVSVVVTTCFWKTEYHTPVTSLESRPLWSLRASL